MKIPDTVKDFLEKQHVLIISTLDKDNAIHTSAKGIIEVKSSGKIYVLDLYKAHTYKNILKNPSATLTVIDERNFRGYSLSGSVKIINKDSIPKNKMEIWYKKLAKRIARRVISHVKKEYSSDDIIPEAKFPMPQYLIEISVNKIIDLTPQRLKKGG